MSESLELAAVAALGSTFRLQFDVELHFFEHDCIYSSTVPCTVPRLPAVLTLTHNDGLLLCGGAPELIPTIKSDKKRVPRKRRGHCTDRRHIHQSSIEQLCNVTAVCTRTGESAARCHISKLWRIVAANTSQVGEYDTCRF